MSAPAVAFGGEWRQPGRRVLSWREWGGCSAGTYERGDGEGEWIGDRHRLVHALTPPPEPRLLEVDGRSISGPLPGPFLLAVYPAGVRVRSAGRSSRYAQLCWGPDLYRAVAPHLPAPPEPPLLMRDDPLVGQMMRSLVAEIGAGTLDRLLAESLVAAIAMRVVQPRDSGPEADIADARLRRVLDHVEAHVGEDLSLEALSAIACLSPCHFSRSFKAAVGMGPRQYVLHRRVERAKALLRRPGNTPASVAADLGFADQSHFTNVFRRETGITPARFRAAA